MIETKTIIKYLKWLEKPTENMFVSLFKSALVFLTAEILIYYLTDGETKMTETKTERFFFIMIGLSLFIMAVSLAYATIFKGFLG